MLWLRGPWDVTGKSKGGAGGSSAGKGNNQGQHGAGVPAALPEESAYLTIFLTSNQALPANTWTRLTPSGILRQSGVANPASGQITVPSGMAKMRFYAGGRFTYVGGTSGGAQAAVNDDTAGFSWVVDNRLVVNESPGTLQSGWLPATPGNLLSMYMHPGNLAGGKNAAGQSAWAATTVWPTPAVFGVDFRP